MKDDNKFKTSHEEKLQVELVEFQENNNILLSDADRDIFLKTLDYPLEPNKNLKNAFTSFLKLSSN